MTEIKELVKEICDVGGVKKGQLIVDIIIDYHKNYNEVLKGEEIIAAIDELVQAGEILEIEYVLPDSDYRVKSIYFPKGTEIRVVKPKSWVIQFS